MARNDLNKLAITFRQKAPSEIWQKIAQAVSENKIFKNYTVLYMLRGKGR